MRNYFAIATLLGVATVSQAQIVTNPDGTITCPATGGAYCAGDSLQTNIIVRCQGTVGQPGNCDDNLAGVPPSGVKTNAFCYQSSPTAGDALCSLNCKAYGDNNTFPITGPGCPGASNSTSTSLPGSTSTPPYSNSTTSTSTPLTSTSTTPGGSQSTTSPGGGGGASTSTFTAVVPGGTTSGSGGSQTTGSSSGATQTPGLQGNDASALSSRSGALALSGLLAGLLAWGLI